MKKHLKYITVGLAALTVTSCADLDTEYFGGYVTSDQRDEVVEDRPEMFQAQAVSVNNSLNQYMAVSSDHYDFGFAALMLGLDCQTADLNGGNSGYNWFQTWSAFAGNRSTGVPTAIAWYTNYNSISVANDLIAAIDPETTDPETLLYLAQGYASRAFHYWVLANLYQFNYQLDPSARCVPIVTDKNKLEVLEKGAPRASVQEVFDQIIGDLNLAIGMLENSVAPEDVLGVDPKRFISLATAHGLRARAYLTMGKYAEAALDAQAAITNFGGAPYSMEEVSKPTFASLTDNAWMWGISVAETDRVVTSGIVNWPSQICSFAYGYVTVGAWRFCSEDLYNSIPYTDVRKGWFLSGNYTSKNLTKAQQEYLNDYVNGDALSYDANQSVYIYPYTNVKFDSYQGVLEQTNSANDIPLMRIEEMYLILAEAQAMSGNPAEGKKTLENFIVEYRDPEYVCEATSAEEIQEEVFQQRRVELWGEGLVYFDYMRLNKGVNRRAAKAPYAFTYDIQPGDPVLIYRIPQGEINANDQISAEDDLPGSPRPAQVDWAE